MQGSDSGRSRQGKGLPLSKRVRKTRLARQICGGSSLPPLRSSVETGHSGRHFEPAASVFDLHPPADAALVRVDLVWRVSPRALLRGMGSHAQCLRNVVCPKCQGWRGTARTGTDNDESSDSGLSVRHDSLESLEPSVTEVVRNLGICRKRRSATVSSCQGVSPEMAIRPDKAFGGADARSRLHSAREPAQTEGTANRIRGWQLSPAA